MLVNIDTITSVEDIPATEDESFEFKSGSTHPDKLKTKISVAASGFWNSGGGVFVIGIDDSTGNADGGFPANIGRTSTEDWIDHAIQATAPSSRYRVKRLDHAGNRGTIDTGKFVFCIEFGSSNETPHMACDNKYYIRAGAHTVPAKNFIVEALWSRRQKVAPQLFHIVRHKPECPDVLQLGVIAMNDEPALDVVVTLSEVPEMWKTASNPFPINLHTLSKHNPFFMDLTTWVMAEQRVGTGISVNIRYKDRMGQEMKYSQPLSPTEGISPWSIGEDWRRSMNKHLDSLSTSIKAIAKSLQAQRR